MHSEFHPASFHLSDFKGSIWSNILESCLKVIISPKRIQYLQQNTSICMERGMVWKLDNLSLLMWSFQKVYVLKYR